MKIGLLFGSFDPFHIGHLSMITSALNSKVVENVLVIIAYQNPWKGKYVTNFQDRFNIASEGCKGLFHDVKISSVEYKLNNILNRPPFTFEVIDYIKESNPNDEFYIITSDETFFTIPEWKNGEQILSGNDFILVHREGGRIYPKDVSFKSCFVTTRDFNIEISSTCIRDMLHMKRIPIPYISADQYYYIKQHNLY